MNSTDLKKEIHKKVDVLEDQYILEGICRFLALNSDDDQVYHVTDELKAKLRRSTEQIEKGEYLTHDELNDKIDKWLNA